MDKQSPEMIEREMEQTRASLVEKVAALENQVVGTLQTATSTVKDTVDTVKDTVSNVKEAVTGTVETVKDTVQTSVENVTDNVKGAFDLRTHVENHPWTCVGIAALAGFGVGWMLGGRRDSYAASASGLRSSSLYDTYQRETGPSTATAPMASAMASASDSYHEPSRAAAPAEPRRPGLFDQLFSRFSDEIASLGQEAFHHLSTSLRHNLSDSIPRIIENAVSAGSAAVQNAVGSAVGSPGAPSTGPGRTDSPYAERTARPDQGYRG